MEFPFDREKEIRSPSMPPLDTVSGLRTVVDPFNEKSKAPVQLPIAPMEFSTACGRAVKVPELFGDQYRMAIKDSNAAGCKVDPE